jgi:hypothetical protein
MGHLKLNPNYDFIFNFFLSLIFELQVNYFSEEKSIPNSENISRLSADFFTFQPFSDKPNLILLKLARFCDETIIRFKSKKTSSFPQLLLNNDIYLVLAILIRKIFQIEHKSPTDLIKQIKFEYYQNPDIQIGMLFLSEKTIDNSAVQMIKNILDTFYSNFHKNKFKLFDETKDQFNKFQENYGISFSIQKFLPNQQNKYSLDFDFNSLSFHCFEQTRAYLQIQPNFLYFIRQQFPIGFAQFNFYSSILFFKFSFLTDMNITNMNLADTSYECKLIYPFSEIDVFLFVDKSVLYFQSVTLNCYLSVQLAHILFVVFPLSPNYEFRCEIFTHFYGSFLLLFKDQKKFNSFKNQISNQKLTIFSPPFNNCLFPPSYLEQWNEGKLSNVNFIFWLNLLSGRSFNDSNRYPIFPWLIKNMDSQSLHLESSSDYFVLENYFNEKSKPIFF